MIARFSIVVASIAAFACAAAGGDVVQKKDGTFNPAVKGETPTQSDYDASNWQVLDADTDVVKYQLNVGGKVVLQTLKSIDVMEIWLEPKDYPGLWKDAVNAMASGNYQGAAQAFQSIGAEAKVHPVVRQKALLFAARSFASWGKPTEADAAFDALFKAFPKSFYTMAVWKERSQMWMDANKEEKARAAADTLVKLPGVSDGDKLEADFLLVTIEYRKAAAAGDKAAIKTCLDKFKALAQQTAGRPGQAGVNALAQIGTANCLLELGSVGEAKAIFDAISTTAREAPVCAAAFNGLGDCWFRQNNKDGWVEARRCFLRTSLLYTEGTSSDQIAKALYYAAECFTRLQDTEKWGWAAKQEAQDCIRRFPTSPWAQKARVLLQGLPK